MPNSIQSIVYRYFKTGRFYTYKVSENKWFINTFDCSYDSDWVSIEETKVPKDFITMLHEMGVFDYGQD